jgi:hypothetical protein
VTVAWQAPPECPGTDAFLAGVRQRTETATVVAGGEASAVRCTVRRQDRQYEGTFVVVGDEGASVPRTVRSDDCVELAATLELMVALALDRRDLPPIESDAPVTTAAADAPAIPLSPAPAPAPTSPRDSSVASRGDEGPGVAHSDLSAKVSEQGVTVGASVDLRALGITAWSVGPFAQWRVRLPLPRATLRASLQVAWASADVGTVAAYRWFLGVLDGCAYSVAVSSALELQPCLRVEGGALDASSSAGVDVPVVALRPWFATGALGRADYQVGWGSLELEAGGSVPLIRDAFFFDPRIVNYRPPAGFVWAGAGASVPFP